MLDIEFPYTKRDDLAVMALIEEDDKNSTWVAKADLEVIFPTRYMNNKLGSFDDKFNVVGFICFRNPATGIFGLTKICALVPITPDEINVMKIDEVEYYRLVCYRGSIICPNTNLVERQVLAYEIYNEFVSKHRLPPYFDAVDDAKVLDTLPSYCGVSLPVNRAITRVYPATTTRWADDIMIPLREKYKKQSDVFAMQGEYTSLNSVSFGATNTFSRLNGNYMADGLDSALANPSQSVETVEQIVFS